MEKKLFFTVKKADENLLDLFFDSPEETKIAYKAMRRLLGNKTDGMMLIAKPEWAIILEKNRGAWFTWLTHMMAFVNEDLFATEGKYYFRVIEGHLVPCKSEYLPMAVRTNLPATT